MKLYHKLLLSFTGVALLVGIVGYFSYLFHDSTGYEVVQLKESAILEIENAGHMAQVLHASQIALRELLEEHYQAVQDPAAASEAGLGIGRTRRTLQEIFFQFEHYLAESREATETGKTKAAQRGEDDEVEGEEEELTWLADLDEAFYEYRASTEEFIRLMEQDGDAAVAYLETVLEPHFHDRLLPLIDQYQEDAHEEFGERVEQVQAYVDYVGWQIGLISVLAVLVAFILGFFITRSITGPLKKATDVADRITAGDRNVPIEVTSQDEAGLLLATMKRMLHAINTAEELQARQLAIMESTTDFIGIITLDGRIQYINQAGRAICGLAKDADVTTMRAEDFHSAQIAPQIAEEIIPAAMKKGIWSGESAFLHRDGHEIPMSMVVLAHRSDDGKVRYLSTISRDITARKQAEEVDNIIASMADPLLVTDMNRAIQRVNQATLDLLGYREEDILGQSVAFLFADPYEHVDTLVEKLEQGGFAGRLETHFRTRQGATMPISLSGTLLHDRNGQELGLVCVARDITERERYERELVSAKEKAEEMTRLKDAFLTNMSHEIRTPLTAIIGFADLLADEVPEDQREAVQFMKDGGDRLLETLNAVLDLAHLEANSFELVLEPVDVGVSLRKAAGLFSSLAQKKALDLRLDLPDAPVFIEADQAGFERILGNLLSNAIKFTEAGWVAVQAYTDEASVHVEVEDTGIGIDEAFIPHLFDEFKQESTGLSRDHEGSGLGLAIVKRLVESMEGTITVQSMKGHGSRFRLSFPRVSSAAQVEDPIEQPEQPVATASAPVGQPTRHAPLRILMAEDNPINQKVLLRLIERLGHTADVVGDGQKVLEALERAPYDLILMDIQMPVMNGLEATRQICARYGAAQRPRIIAVTANAMEGDRERCLDAGMDDYLSKPVRLEALGTALRGCLPSKTADAVNGALNENQQAQPAIDAAVLQALHNTLGEEDSASLNDLFTLFLEDASDLLEKTSRAAETGDRAALQRAAHTLKSTGAAFGAMRLARLCRELEQMGKEGNLGEAAATAAQAKAAFSEVRREIQARWLN